MLISLVNCNHHREVKTLSNPLCGQARQHSERLDDITIWQLVSGCSAETIISINTFNEQKIYMKPAQLVRSSSAKGPAKRSAKTQIRSKTRLKSELDLATEIWSKNILRPNLDLSKVLRPDLKMIGKGFVLFEINSSPSAFYIIKLTCIVIGF